MPPANCCRSFDISGEVDVLPAYLLDALPLVL